MDAMTSPPNEVWAIDFQFDETADYRRLKLTNIVDEFTREALAMDVNRSSGTDDLVSVIDRLVAERGAPCFLRMDHGPELIAWALRDWCRRRARGPSISSRAHPGRTPSLSRSTAVSETSC